jgi:16S rRNA (cytosine1402-N4)-methyltransferase
MTAVHVPVLLHEVITGLSLSSGAVVVDATLGAGGYAKALCEVVGSEGVLVGFDRDAEAVLRAREVLKGSACTTHLLECDFRHLDAGLAQAGVNDVDAVIFDLGLSSLQLESSGRGFSFQKNEPLLMTFADRPGKDDITARHIVNDWSEEVIANVLYGYGEERFARRIARGIILARAKKPVETTHELTEIVATSVPESYRRQKIHPATRTFQALRIAVNDEIRALEETLPKTIAHLKSNGRVAVVSFHSIEDRIVKRFFIGWEREEMGKRVTKKPITPSEKETKENPRSRSAKLRIFEKA